MIYPFVRATIWPFFFLFFLFGAFPINGSYKGARPTVKKGFSYSKSDFKKLSGATSLEDLVVRGKPLHIEKGEGIEFGSQQWMAYKKLKNKTQSQERFSIQWALMDLNTGKILGKSKSAKMNFYGASVSKIFTAGAFLESLEQTPTTGELYDLAKLISVSDNQAWGKLQKKIGKGNNYKGMGLTQSFTEKLGLKRSQSFRGWMDHIHGNETNVIDVAKFLRATYQEKFKGAGTLWKLLYTCRTGRKRLGKYFPSRVSIGGKTGSYTGLTQFPKDDLYPKTLKSRSYFARVKHHAAIFQYRGKVYAMVVFSDRANNEDLALLGGGIIREYLNLDHSYHSNLYL